MKIRIVIGTTLIVLCVLMMIANLCAIANPCLLNRWLLNHATSDTYNAETNTIDLVVDGYLVKVDFDQMIRCGRKK